MEEIKGKSILILGYAKEGKSVHQFLLKNYPDRQIGIADCEAVRDCIDSSAKIHSGADYLASIDRYDTIVRSPGITLKTPELQDAIARGQHVTSATNLFFSRCPGTAIGVTGTKGKSTTSTLIYKILSQHYTDVRFVGNIGSPSLDSLRNASAKTLFVFELSSYQLDDARYSPQIAVLLNIVPEHLDYHGGFLSYIEAKKNIVRYQTKTGFAIANPNREIVEQAIAVSPAQKRYFTPHNSDNRPYCAYVENNSIVAQTQEGKPNEVISLDDIPLLGSGNLENTLAATTVGVLLKVPFAKIKSAIANFKPLKHRLEFIGEYRGIRFYNDSIASVPEAAMNAIEALGNDVKTLIAGGNDRGLDFSEFGKYLAEKSIETLILFPDTGVRIWEATCNAIHDPKLRPKKYDVTSMEEAVRIAYQTTSPGTICLLSPASPRTRPLFRTFDERGDLFRKFAIELGNAASL